MVSRHTEGPQAIPGGGSNEADFAASCVSGEAGSSAGSDGCLWARIMPESAAGKVASPVPSSGSCSGSTGDRLSLLSLFLGILGSSPDSLQSNVAEHQAFVRNTIPAIRILRCVCVKHAQSR